MERVSAGPVGAVKKEKAGNSTSSNNNSDGGGGGEKGGDRKLSLKARMRQRLRKNKKKNGSFGEEAATNVRSSISVMQRQLEAFNLQNRASGKAPPALAAPSVDVAPGRAASTTPPPLPPATPTTDSGKMRIEWMSPEAKQEWEMQYRLQQRPVQRASASTPPRGGPTEDAFNMDLSVGSGKSPLLQNIEDRKEDLQATMRRRGLLKLASSSPER